ncbi:MAG: F0F1 ATP synthase subunit delta [Pseudomonadota bacterium]
MASQSELSAGPAGRYATALYELAEDARALDAVAGDLGRLKGLVANSPELRRLIASPLLSRDAQAKAMAAVIERAEVSDLVRRLVGTLARNRRLFALVGIIDAFLAMLAARRGEVKAEVASAAPLSAAQAEAVADALKGAVGRKVAIDLKVDPALLGGLKVKVGSRLVDDSLGAKLQKLRLAMKGFR